MSGISHLRYQSVLVCVHKQPLTVEFKGRHLICLTLVTKVLALASDTIGHYGLHKTNRECGCLHKTNILGNYDLIGSVNIRTISEYIHN